MAQQASLNSKTVLRRVDFNELPDGTIEQRLGTPMNPNAVDSDDDGPIRPLSSRMWLLPWTNTHNQRECCCWCRSSSSHDAAPPVAYRRNDSMKVCAAIGDGLYHCLGNSAVIDPEKSTWLFKWDSVEAVVVMVVAFVWPYETAFLDTSKLHFAMIFNVLADIVLVMSILLQFVIAYPDPLRPRLVKEIAEIARHYLSGHFWLDVLALVPADRVGLAVFGATGSSCGRNCRQVLRFARILRLLRLTRIMRLVERWRSSFGFSNAGLMFIRLLGALALLCHWMACLWGGLVDWERARGEWTTWLDALMVAKSVSSTAQEEYEYHWNVYCVSLYWAVVTLTSIGYGDITPQTLTEYRLVTFFSCIMASMWAYAIGAICGIISKIDIHEETFKEDLDSLNWFMRDRNMPQDMRIRLRKFFYEAKEVNKQREMRSVVDHMSPMLQGECAMFMHQERLARVWYLQDMDREIIICAARSLNILVYAPNEEVLEERSLFIVQRGVAAHRGRILGSNDFWGEDMILSNPNLRWSAKARSLTHCTVLTLKLTDLVRIAKDYPQAMVRLRWAQIKIAIQRGMQILVQRVKEMEQRQEVDLDSLDDEARVKLYTEILEDMCKGSAVDHFQAQTSFSKPDSNPPDSQLESPRRDGSAIKRTKSGSLSSGVSALDEDDTRAILATLVATVNDLKASLENDGTHEIHGRARSLQAARAASADRRGARWPDLRMLGGGGLGRT